MRRTLAVAGFSFWALSCAHGTTVEKVDVDTYHITCRDLPLDRCLSATVDNVCDKRAYFVARGISDVNQRGRSEVPDVSASSEVVVRCSSGHGWGEEEAKALMAPGAKGSLAPPLASSPPRVAAPAATPSPPPAPPVCAPGSTQSCVGAGACPGGQACKADGSGYEPCDCGSGAH